VLCESAYSPDPSLLAEPIAGRLRKLKLENFRDAVIGSQVSGEARPDWLLRVDLTTPDKILKEWARWGDVQAIAKLLNQHLAPSQVEVRTLHLFCSKVSRKGQQPKGQEYPNQQKTTEPYTCFAARFPEKGNSRKGKNTPISRKLPTRSPQCLPPSRPKASARLLSTA